MENFHLLLEPAFVPFTAALLSVLVVALVEVTLTLILGTGGADFIEAIVDVHPLPDTSFTNWLLVRELPLLMAIFAFGAGFGGAGLLMQVTATALTGTSLPLYVAVPLAMVLGHQNIRLVSRLVSKLGLVSTTALSPAEFLGNVATLSSPSVSQGYAGVASFTDKHGYTHYVMVEPESPTDTFHQGDRLVLVSQVNRALYHVRKA